MAIPKSKDARLYYRCAFQRIDDAYVLQQAAHTTGAVYLAGYGVECILNALILASVPSALQNSVLMTFRGARAHDFGWLRTAYLTKTGVHFPADVTRHFTFVNDWSTELRYNPTVVRVEDATAFLKAAQAIIKWADGRL